MGGKIEQNLAIIKAVSANLNPRQVARLRKTAGVRVFEDRSLVTEGNVLGLLSPVTSPVVTAVSSLQTPTDGSGQLLPTLLYQTNYPMLVGADTLQQSGITGKGVTIAVLDSGLWQDPSQNYGSRLLASIDVLNGGSGPVQGDPYGHGTHVTSIAAGGAMNLSGNYLSIAPQANLVVVRAFDGTGAGRYADVIAGLNWIVANQTEVQHPRTQSIIRRDAGVVLLGRSARSSRHGRLARRHRGRHRGRQRGPDRDDDRCAGKRALRHHDRCPDRQLHTLQPER